MSDVLCFVQLKDESWHIAFTGKDLNGDTNREEVWVDLVGCHDGGEQFWRKEVKSVAKRPNGPVCDRCTHWVQMRIGGLEEQLEILRDVERRAMRELA